ncbi:2-oxo acid dehydrogenase subunit E2, partial [Bacillus sp. SS-TM]
SFDHRLIDGATAQKALNQIKRLLNDFNFVTFKKAFNTAS